MQHRISLLACPQMAPGRSMVDNAKTLAHASCVESCRAATTRRGETDRGHDRSNRNFTQGVDTQSIGLPSQSQSGDLNGTEGLPEAVVQSRAARCPHTRAPRGQGERRNTFGESHEKK